MQLQIGGKPGLLLNGGRKSGKPHKKQTWKDASPHHQTTNKIVFESPLCSMYSDFLSS